MKYWQWLLIAGFTLCLVGVRYWETTLFYDPFLAYFKGKTEGIPSFEWKPLIVSHLFRFFLNFIFSLAIIHFFFLNRQWTIQAGMVILALFFIIFPFYLYSIANELYFGELFTFYLRRMVIQPVMVLIMVPVFFYLKK